MLSAAELSAVYGAGHSGNARGFSVRATGRLSAYELSDVYGSMTIGAPPRDASEGGSGPARADNRRTIASSGPKSKAGGLKVGGAFKKGPNPPFLARRAQLFDRMLEQQASRLASLPKEQITVTMPDGKQLQKTAWVDSPLSIAEGIGKQFAGRMCVAALKYSRRLPGIGEVIVADDMDDDAEAHTEGGWELWDLARPFEGDCELKLIGFDEPEGRETFWHSSSHVLGGALEQLYGSQLTHGPPTSGGFFYDSYMGTDVVPADEHGAIEKKAKEISKAKSPFVRLVISKEQALELFSDNPFKVHTIQTKVPDGALTTAYRCGDVVDLCRGPHLPHTGKVEAFAVVKNSSAYFLGQVRRLRARAGGGRDGAARARARGAFRRRARRPPALAAALPPCAAQANCDSLQRVYGISFPDSKQLNKWRKFQEEAAKRDHRRIGTDQELFFFHELSPGSCFFLPHGARLYNALIEFIRGRYWGTGAPGDRVYHEVITPNMYNMDLWVTSGHAAKCALALRGAAKRARRERARLAARRPKAPRALMAAARALCAGLCAPLQVQGAHVQLRRGASGVWAQANELPGPLPHVQAPRALVPRAAAAARRLWRAAPQRAVGRAHRAHARPPLPAGRRAHLLHARAGEVRGARRA